MPSEKAGPMRTIFLVLLFALLVGDPRSSGAHMVQIEHGAVEWSITVTPAAADAGQQVVISGQGPAGAIGDCGVRLDGRQLVDADCRVDRGVITGSFVVPVGGASGTVAVEVCGDCSGIDPSWTATGVLDIKGGVPASSGSPSSAMPVPVPDLLCADAHLAAKMIYAAELMPSGDQHRGLIVVGQHPPAGTSVVRGSMVAYYVHTAGPVEVPELGGLDVGGADTVLTAVGLHLDHSAEAGARVVGQDPSAGSIVEPCTGINAQFAVPTIPPSTTPVTSDPNNSSDHPPTTAPGTSSGDGGLSWVTGRWWLWLVAAIVIVMIIIRSVRSPAPGERMKPHHRESLPGVRVAVVRKAATRSSNPGGAISVHVTLGPVRRLKENP